MSLLIFLFVSTNSLLCGAQASQPTLGVSTNGKHQQSIDAGYGQGLAGQSIQNLMNPQKDTAWKQETAKSQERSAGYKQETQQWKNKEAEIKAQREKYFSYAAIPKNKEVEPKKHRWRFATGYPLDKIEDLPLDYEFKYNGPEHEELIRLYKDLSKLKWGYPFPKQENARALGLAAVKESDEAYSEGQEMEGTAFKTLAQDFLNLAVGWDPITGITRSTYELITGKNMVTSEILSGFERGMAFAGVITMGGESVAARMAGVASKFGTLQHVQLAVLYGRELLVTRGGLVLQHIRKWGVYQSEATYQFFDRASHISNPFPKDGWYARIVPKEFAQKILNGELPFSPTKETFITAYEDIAKLGHEAGKVAEKLSLYADGAATTIRDLGGHVIIKFRMTEEVLYEIRTPIQNLVDRRTFGFISGGRTKGGAREWIISPDAIQKEVIDRYQIYIEELFR